MLHNPIQERFQSPAQPSLTGYQQITLNTQDEVRLSVWYLAPQNGAAVILLHGYKADHAQMLPIAAMLVRHGYGVILPDLRGHGQSEGELITFGYYERRDVDAVYQYLIAQPDVDAERIGVLGNSMGGAIAILYAAENPKVKAIVAQSPYTSLYDMVGTNVKRVIHWPPFPLAPMILFFAERKAGFQAEALAPIRHIRQISPRPVFIMMGGKDTWANPDGGRQLYAAAGEPRELWFDPELEHLEFSEKRAGEFEQRAVAFFDKYLLNKP
jgi:alpha-beta hydrolase superfamily lysophospholipase